MRGIAIMPRNIYYAYDTPGAKMLHELMHWKAMTDAIPVPPINDYGQMLDPNGSWVNDPNAVDPYSGYGP